MQPQLWYWPDGSRKRLHITASRIARREVYSENLRKCTGASPESSSSSAMSTGKTLGQQQPLAL
jgi:hypothetical protein